MISNLLTQYDAFLNTMTAGLWGSVAIALSVSCIFACFFIDGALEGAGKKTNKMDFVLVQSIILSWSWQFIPALIIVALCLALAFFSMSLTHKIGSILARNLIKKGE